MASVGNFNISNLEFLVNWQDGETKDEVESEISRIMFQLKNTAHYDRGLGAGFQNIEQSIDKDLVQMIFASDMVESIYKLNRGKNFKPFIAIGYEDISIGNENDVTVKYRLWQDLSITGKTSSSFNQQGSIL